ncbi:MAG: permease, partial [Actinomycetota bacterium]
MAIDVDPRSSTSRRAMGRESNPPVIWVVAVLVGVAVLVRLTDPASLPWLRNLLIVFGSLLVEAMPFILVGATVSAAIEVLVPASAFARIALLPRGLQLPAAAAAGVAFPVCECGSVPVARRLAAKGLAPGAAVTFMLAAPIVNPVVVASTFVAYRGLDTLWVMVLGRLALGFVVAMAAGWVMGRIRSGELLRARAGEVEAHEVDAAEPRWRRFFGHLSGDVVFMARFLIMGAALAATIQTFVPQS